jgi:hypothetical protein
VFAVGLILKVVIDIGQRCSALCTREAIRVVSPSLCDSK